MLSQVESRLRVDARKIRIRHKNMAAKDERIGFRVPSDLKAVLLHIAKKEGRSLAQICELLLRGGVLEYEKDGPGYLHRLLAKTKERNKG